MSVFYPWPILPNDWLAILFGFIFGWLSRNLIFGGTSIYDLDLQSIGYIIPGLIANWMERQGVIKTISVMLIALSNSVLVIFMCIIKSFLSLFYHIIFY
jgi:hypothetical protein